jgi:hypothetical protein
MPKSKAKESAAMIRGDLAFAGHAIIGSSKTPDGAIAQRNFTIVAYTGAAIDQPWWDAPVVIDLDGLDLGDGVMPILDDHSPTRGCVVGQSASAGVEKGQLVLRGAMMAADDITDSGMAVREILKLADPPNNFRWQTSIGARSTQKEFVSTGETVKVNGQKFNGPIYVSRKTVIREVSFVVIGADRDTSALVASGDFKMKFADFCSSKGFDASKLDATQTKSLQDLYAAGNGGDKPSKKDRKKEKKLQAKEAAKVVKGDAKKVIKATAEKVKDKVKSRVDDAIREQRDIFAAEQERMRRIVEITANEPSVLVEIDVADGKTEKVNLREHAIKAGWSVQDTELGWLRARRPDTVNGFVSQQLPAGDAVIECAILQAGNCQLFNNSFYEGRQDRAPVEETVRRNTQNEMTARYGDQVQTAAQKYFKSGIGLQQVLLIAARAGGYRGEEKITAGNLGEVMQHAFNPNIRAEGGSMISVQNVLANVLNKFLLQGYLYVDQSWKQIAATRAVKDFKPSKSINVFGDFVFKKLNADGQIQNAAMTDEAFANQVDTFGRKLGIQRQMIINDDLSALSTVPLLMGIGAADSINILFWKLWLAPGNWTDGNAFWFNRTAAASVLGGSAINTNLISGGTSALSSASLQLAVQAYDKQIKPNGQPLGMQQAILLYPPELDATALELMRSANLVYGGATASKQPMTNVWQGRFQPVKSPYLSNTGNDINGVALYPGNSTTAWWLLANPNLVAAIEVAFLNGQQTPTVQTAQANFNELGIDVRGFFDFGAAMQNPRAGIKSAGA